MEKFGRRYSYNGLSLLRSAGAEDWEDCLHLEVDRFRLNVRRIKEALRLSRLSRIFSVNRLPLHQRSRFSMWPHYAIVRNVSTGKEFILLEIGDWLARKREDRRDDEGRCVEESESATLIEFATADDRVHGFAYSQLMNYTLEKISESEHKADAPQDRLQLFFSTHDVTLSGWRLRDFLRLLRDDKVAAVKTGHARYANLRHDTPFVTEIKIAQVKTQE